MSNLIPITKIYDIYPKYTFSKDVMRFMDDIVDIPRAEVFYKDEVITMFEELQMEIAEVNIIKNVTDQKVIHKTPSNIKQDCIAIIQQKINSLKENTDGNK